MDIYDRTPELGDAITNLTALVRLLETHPEHIATTLALVRKAIKSDEVARQRMEQFRKDRPGVRTYGAF